MYRLSLLGGIDLRGPDGASVGSVLSQPKRLALLVLLALRRPRGYHQRDTLLALLWPEHDHEHGRVALRKGIHHLRRSLGAEAIQSRGDEVGLGEGSLWCDALAFEESVERGDLDRAYELYRGDLLPGFFIQDASEFERWLDGERSRLRRCALEAACRAERTRAEDPLAALPWARLALEIAPGDETALRRVIALLSRSGDRAAALHAYEEGARILGDVYGLEASPETERLVAGLRTSYSGERAPATEVPSTGATASAALPPSPAVSSAEQASPVRARSRPRRGSLAAIGAASAILLALLPLIAERSPDRAPVLAVGEIRNFSPGDSTLAAALPDLLTSGLAALPGTRVVSSGRMAEMLAASGEERSASALAGAARRAGAEEVLEGALYATDRLRLDVRWVRLRDGRVTASYSAEATDAFALVDSVLAHVAADGRLPAATRAGVPGSRSLLARAFYTRGLDALYRDQLSAARGFFEAAVEEDSTFAMAHFGLAFSGSPGLHAHLDRAARLASGAGDRERLYILAVRAQAINDPAGLAIAETLATRYPNEPTGPLLVGRARLWTGDFAGAVPHLRRVIELDSGSLGRERGPCRACEALQELTLAYLLMDSMPAADSTTMRRLRSPHRRGSALDWRAAYLESVGRFDEARELRREIARTHPDVQLPSWPVTIDLKAGRFEAADSLLRAQSTSGLDEAGAIWVLVMSLRYQGRLEEALAAAERYRALGGDRTLEGIVLFEQGRWGEAAAVWDTLSRARSPLGLHLDARNASWRLTHLAASLAGAGDTAGLRRLIPALELAGRPSAYGRDPRLHHHARGLLHALLGQHEEAIADFRQAIFSSTGGYTRTNLELARSLTVLGRPEEAVATLQPALRGGLDASNLYVTRTDLHEALGRAHEAAGSADSARTHYEWVVRAWARADPQFEPRRRRAEEALQRLAPRRRGR